MTVNRRVVDYAGEIPSRTPAEMLDVLQRIVNRDIERLHIVSKGGREFLIDDAERALLDDSLERVGKLIRALKQIEEEQDPTQMTTEELRKRAGVR